MLDDVLVRGRTLVPIGRNLEFEMTAPTSLKPDVLTPPIQPSEIPAAQRAVAVSSWFSQCITGQVMEPRRIMVEFPETYDAGDLVEFVRGVHDEVATRNRGRLAFVLTSNNASMRSAIKSMAAAYDAPIWLAESWDVIGEAEPALPVTPAKRVALDCLARVGRATASDVARRTGGSSVSVGNMLADLYTQGLVLREEGGGRQGHTYVHPTSTVATSPTTSPLTTIVDLPHDVSAEIAEIAGLAGREPAEIVTEAWRSFMAEHRDEMRASYDEIAGAKHDRAALLAALTRDAPARAGATRPEARNSRVSPLSRNQSSKQE